LYWNPTTAKLQPMNAMAASSSVVQLPINNVALLATKEK